MVAEPARDDHVRRDPHGRFRFGPWAGGSDPLAPPYDLRAALDRIGEDVLSAGSVRDSLRDLLRRGLDGRGGLDRLADRIRRLKAQARRRGELGGTLDQVRAALDQALTAEQQALAAATDDNARLAEMELATLPLYLPVRSGDDVTGLAGLLSPSEHADDELRGTFIEAVIEESEDETLMDRYLGGEEVDEDVLVADLEKAVARASFHPVVPVCSVTGVGCVELL